METIERPMVYSVQEAAAVLGISTSLLYTELKRNPKFPRKMIGNRIMIPARRLAEYMES